MKRPAMLVLWSGVLTGISVCQVSGIAAEMPWSIEPSHASWSQSQASGDNIAITNVLSLKGGDAGQWTSKWYAWQGTVDGAEVAVRAAVAQFANQTIQVVIKGSETPYTDASGVRHTWYGRCMIAIVDENRWIMALRSGISHIAWNTPRKRDTIHLLTSSDGNPDADSGWRELYNGSNVYAVSGLGASRWRLRLHLDSIGLAGSPRIVQVKVSPR